MFVVRTPSGLSFVLQHNVEQTGFLFLIIWKSSLSPNMPSRGALRWKEKCMEQYATAYTGVEPHWEGSFCFHPHPSDFQPVTESCTSHHSSSFLGVYQEERALRRLSS